jgi:hypothetical protein
VSMLVQALGALSPALHTRAVILTTLSQPGTGTGVGGGGDGRGTCRPGVHYGCDGVETINAVPVQSDVGRVGIGASDHRPPWLGSTDRGLHSGHRSRRCVRLAVRVIARADDSRIEIERFVGSCPF